MYKFGKRGVVFMETEFIENENEPCPRCKSELETKMEKLGIQYENTIKKCTNPNCSFKFITSRGTRNKR